MTKAKKIKLSDGLLMALDILHQEVCKKCSLKSCKACEFQTVALNTCDTFDVSLCALMSEKGIFNGAHP